MKLFKILKRRSVNGWEREIERDNFHVTNTNSPKPALNIDVGDYSITLETKQECEKLIEMLQEKVKTFGQPITEIYNK